MMEEKKIKADEVAKALGISVAKLIGWQKRGVLPPAPVMGKKRYYTEEYVKQAKEYLQKYIRGGEVRRILGISDSTLNKLINVGVLSVELRKGQRFFLRKEVEELKSRCPTPEAVKDLLREKRGRSVTWLAKQLGVSRQTLYTWLHQGLLSLPRKEGKTLINSAYLEELKKNLAQRLERAHRIRAQVLRSKEK